MATVENKTDGETAFHGVSTGDTTAVYGEGGAVGVRGDGATWHGVVGISASKAGGAGVYGANKTGGPGIIGESTTWMGVYGKTDSTTGGAGVMGEGVAGGPGVIGKSAHWHGVFGETAAVAATGAAGVWGKNTADGSGVVGQSVSGAGVFATSESGPAGVFDGDVRVQGDVEVSGDIRLLGGDLAELFETTPTPAALAAEPGTLMSLDGDGRVTPSGRAYDKRAVGVVAGAGAYRPGLILDAECGGDARPIAMVGKAYCRVDASFAAIEVGDLLTTSPTVGHAMKATDASRAFGAVVGKALAPMAEGTGLLPIVVTLR